MHARPTNNTKLWEVEIIAVSCRSRPSNQIDITPTVFIGRQEGVCTCFRTCLTKCFSQRQSWPLSPLPRWCLLLLECRGLRSVERIYRFASAKTQFVRLQTICSALATTLTTIRTWSHGMSACVEMAMYLLEKRKYSFQSSHFVMNPQTKIGLLVDVIGVRKRMISFEPRASISRIKKTVLAMEFQSLLSQPLPSSFIHLSTRLTREKCQPQQIRTQALWKQIQPQQTQTQSRQLEVRHWQARVQAPEDQLRSLPQPSHSMAAGLEDLTLRLPFPVALHYQRKHHRLEHLGQGQRKVERTIWLCVILW